jgi:hypothetical protein
MVPILGISSTSFQLVSFVGGATIVHAFFKVVVTLTALAAVIVAAVVCLATGVYQSGELWENDSSSHFGKQVVSA